LYTVESLLVRFGIPLVRISELGRLRRQGRLARPVGVPPPLIGSL
jgi:hypothetical protein